MTNKKKLFEDINPHTRYWDCWTDSPLEYDHTGKVIEICKEFSVSFFIWAKSYQGNDRNNWSLTTEELMKIYLENGKI